MRYKVTVVVRRAFELLLLVHVPDVWQGPKLEYAAQNFGIHPPNVAK